MPEKSHHNFQNWILLAVLTLIWGSSYILMKKSLTAFSALELATLRLSISLLVSLPFAIRSLMTMPREKYFTVLQIGIFGTGGPAILFAIAMPKLGSAVSGIFNSLSPLWTLVVGIYFFKVAGTRQKILGVITGFIGALILMLGKRNGNFQADVWFSLLPVIATFCYGISTNIMKQKLQHDNPIYTTSVAMMMVGIPAFAGLCMGGAPSKIMSGTVWPQFACVAALSVFGTLIAWVLYYRLVQRTDALFGASVTYLVPIVAIGWGLLDGEVLSLLQFLGMALILTGVYFTTSSKKLPGL